MTPSAWLILIVTILYFGIAITKMYTDDIWIGGMWAAYALANVCLFIREFTL